jgi:hypothetical protein
MRTTPFRPILALLVGLALAAASAGCIGAAGASGGLYVKDAATNELREAHVTFTKAQVLPNGSESWVTVFDGVKTIELLSLNASTAKEKLADLSLAPGQYAKLRITIGDVRIVYPNGTEQLLNVMGNVVTIAEDFTVAADGSLDLVVDFDLDEGIDIETGTYTPFVEDVQKSSDDSDDDGINDVEDADDDDDGANDEVDHDDDGDGADDDEETTQEHEDEEEMEAAENDYDESNETSDDANEGEKTSTDLDDANETTEAADTNESTEVTDTNETSEPNETDSP